MLGSRSGGRVGIGAVRIVIKQRLHFFAALEERNGLASDRNQSPCARISSGPAFPKLHKKTPSSEACWASKVWPSVLTRAYPTIISSSTYFVSLADSWVDCCSCALICIANSCVLSQLAQSRGTSKVRCLEGFGERSHPPSSTYGSIRTPWRGALMSVQGRRTSALPQPTRVEDPSFCARG